IPVQEDSPGCCREPGVTEEALDAALSINLGHCCPNLRKRYPVWSPSKTADVVSLDEIAKRQKATLREGDDRSSPLLSSHGHIPLSLDPKLKGGVWNLQKSSGVRYGIRGLLVVGRPAVVDHHHPTC